MGSKTGKFRKLGGGAMVRVVPRSQLWRGEATPVESNKIAQPKTKAPRPKDRVIKRPGVEEDSDVVFYWAYGSNLSVDQMRRRCPRAEHAGSFTVTGARLVFRGVADVVVEEGSLCPGGLWKITPACERALDQFEGVSSGLYLKKYFKVRRNKHVYKCLFYQMASERGVAPPSESYVDIIVRGYRDFGLDLDYLDIAIQESWSNKRITTAIRDRRARRGETNLVKDLYSGEIA